MPFTPYHFGPSALLALPLKKYIDIPVFILANVVVDLEPGAVMIFNLDYPLHGYLHTFLVAGLAGLLWGLAAYPMRPLFGWAMGLLRFDYKSTLVKMMLSGMLGCMFHVFIDSFLYKEMNPFWPITGNPLYAVLSYRTVLTICEVSIIIAVVLYLSLAVGKYRKEKTRTQTPQD